MTERRTGFGNLIPHRLLRSGQVHHPAVVEEAKRRNKSFQLRLADMITAFAGSMNFVFIHAVIFAIWMVFLEKSPWPTLTLVVSLEAAKADHDFQEQELELKTNTELTREIDRLTQEVHRRLLGEPGSDNPP